MRIAMIFRIVRSFVRRPQSTTAADLTTNCVAFTPTSLARVSRPYSTQLRRQSFLSQPNGSSSTSRTYATRPASRPKAHTGRTTNTPRQKATQATGNATTNTATRTKRPKAIPKTTGETRPRAKPKAKPKPKAKSKPKAKKVLTEKQKNAVAVKKTKADIKNLKESVLTPPKNLPDTAWLVVSAESTKRRSDGAKLSVRIKEASAKYKSLSPEEHERYNHIANENKAQNMAAYQKWVESHTPAEIERNNLARHALSRRGVGSRGRSIKDDRRVLRTRPPVAFFLKERFDSGDFKGIKVREAVGLVGREWKGLTDSEKKKYHDATAQDVARYRREVKSVYNSEVIPRTTAAQAA